MNWDNSILKIEKVIEGGDATPPENPTRPDDDEYSYTFTGWKDDYTNVTSNRTITAEYTATPLSNILPSPNGYDITQKLDNTTVEYIQESEEIVYGQYTSTLQSKFNISYNGNEASDTTITTITIRIPKNKVSVIRYSNLDSIEWISKDDTSKTFIAGNVTEGVYTQIIDTSDIPSATEYDTLELRFRNVSTKGDAVINGYLEMGWSDKTNLFTDIAGQSYSEDSSNCTVSYTKDSEVQGTYNISTSTSIEASQDPIATLTLKLPLNRDIRIKISTMLGARWSVYGKDETPFDIIEQTTYGGVTSILNHNYFKQVDSHNEVIVKLSTVADSKFNGRIIFSYV